MGAVILVFPDFRGKGSGQTGRNVNGPSSPLQRLGKKCLIRVLPKWGGWMPEWIGTALFLSVVALTGMKLAEDFGERGLRGYGMLLVLTTVYAAAIGFAYL